MIDSPIFLVGAERSGSTLLRLMLDSHPEITGCEGFEFLVDQVGDDGSRPPLDEYYDYLATHNIFGSAGLEVDRSLDYDALVDSFLQQRLDLSGKSQVSAMVHFGFARLLEIWPDARFIHLLRDPRDVAKSVVEMGWHGNVWFGVDKWIEAETEWGKVLPGLRDDQYLEVEFADLIGDHDTQLKRVCQFLGVDYSDRMLDYAEHTAYKVPQPSKVSKWNRTMTEREVQLVEAKVGSLLTERGFEPSGYLPITVSRADEARLRADSRIGAWRRRVDRFGPRLFVEGFIARLVPSTGYARSVRLRYNEIERANRKQSWREPGREFSTKDETATSSTEGR